MAKLHDVVKHPNGWLTCVPCAQTFIGGTVQPATRAVEWRNQFLKAHPCAAVRDTDEQV